MRDVGFSTGALALGNFSQGIELQRLNEVRACELSALREDELEGLVIALPSLDLSHFNYLSFHAPSSLKELDDKGLVEKLSPVLERGIPVVVHPDIIKDFEPWKSIGDLLLLENMDSRKDVCQTSQDLQWFFEQLPEARFCFDIGHARQYDPTMSVAVDLLLRFQDRLAEVHISEVNWECHHVALNNASKWAYSRISPLIPKHIPVIIESLLPNAVTHAQLPQAIQRELASVRECLDSEDPSEYLQKSRIGSA